MIQHICLITPPSVFLLDERVFMTLGILKVAAVLERAGVQVDMLDLSGVENYDLQPPPSTLSGCVQTLPNSVD